MQVTDRVLLIGLDKSVVGNLRKAVEEVVASTAGEPIQAFLRQDVRET